MGMRYLFSPGRRKRGEPPLDVVVSPPGGGLLEASGRKPSVKEGGAETSSEVGTP